MNMHDLSTKCNQCGNNGYYYSQQKDESMKFVECPRCIETRKALELFKKIKARLSFLQGLIVRNRDQSDEQLILEAVLANVITEKESTK